MAPVNSAPLSGLRARVGRCGVLAVRLTALVLVGACEESVELGTQCRPRTGCPDRTQGLPALDGGTGVVSPPLPELDAAEPAEPSDAGVPSADFFANGGLEATNSGDLAVVDLSVNTRGVMDPWSACQLINFNAGGDAGVDTAANSVQSVALVDGNEVRPYEGRSFLAMSFLPILPPAVVAVPISQILGSPLRAGRSYAFSAYVYRVDHDHEYSLRVWLSDGAPACSPQSPAVADVPVPDPVPAAWTKICVSFTPDVDAQEIMIAAGANYLAIPRDKTEAFLLDAMHADPTCLP